jgi:hypothetical protein
MSCDNLSNFYERSKRELEDFWDIFQYDKNIDDDLISPENDSPEQGSIIRLFTPIEIRLIRISNTKIY